MIDNIGKMRAFAQRFDKGLIIPEEPEEQRALRKVDGLIDVALGNDQRIDRAEAREIDRVATMMGFDKVLQYAHRQIRAHSNATDQTFADAYIPETKRSPNR